MTGTNGQALIYCRVSTKNQEEGGTSLETQEAACRVHAESEGYAVAGVFREVYSGHEALDRPALNRLREEVKSRAHQAVIVYAIDRLTRRQGLTFVLLHEWDRYGAELLSVSDPLDKTAQGKFMLSAKEFIAEVEREKIRERSLRGKRARLKDGKLHNSGRELYGYRRDKAVGKRLVYEPEAIFVRLIFQWASEGVPLREIARRLNHWSSERPADFEDTIPLSLSLERALLLLFMIRPLADFAVSYLAALDWVVTIRDAPAPSTRKVKREDGQVPVWGKSTVRRILTEPAYKGETIAWKWQHRTREMHDASEQIALPEGTTPAIISSQAWDNAQKRLEDNRGAPPRLGGRPYLLRGLVFCAVCGRRMRADVEHGRRVYRCSSRDSVSGPCGAKRVTADDTVPFGGQPRAENGQTLAITEEMHDELATVPGIERAIWEDVARTLSDPNLIGAEVERLRLQGPDIDVIDDLAAARRAVSKLDRQQERLIGLYAAADDDMPLEVVKQQMAATQRQKDEWLARIGQLEERLAAEQTTMENLEALSTYCERVAQNLESFGFEEKRLALEAMGVRVSANGREWDWHSDTLVATDAGREYTTC